MRAFEDAAARAYAEGRREQRCPDCGREEAGGAYCTGCYRPVHPDEWHAPAGEVSEARREAARRRWMHQDRDKPAESTE